MDAISMAVDAASMTMDATPIVMFSASMTMDAPPMVMDMTGFGTAMTFLTIL